MIAFLMFNIDRKSVKQARVKHKVGGKNAADLVFYSISII